MASIAGNKRRHCEHTLDVKYLALMEIERGVAGVDPEIFKRGAPLCRPPWLATEENFRFQMA